MTMKIEGGSVEVMNEPYNLLDGVGPIAKN